MHDSRGAEIKVGDRVLIEAEVTELQGGDENFCCCAIKVVLPDQAGKEKVMEHRPTLSALSTKMLTKIGAAVIALILFALPAFAQPYTPQKATPTSLFGWQEQRQILQLQKQLADQNAAQIAPQNQLILFLLQQQQQGQRQAAPQQQQQLPPINIYLPPGYQGPKIDPNPGTPKLDPSPGIPKIDPNPGVPKLDPNPGVPKIDPNPGVPKIDPKPAAPKLDPNPGTPGPGTSGSYQRYTTDRPPIITATITDRNGVTRKVPAAVWKAAP